MNLDEQGLIKCQTQLQNTIIENVKQLVVVKYYKAREY